MKKKTALSRSGHRSDNNQWFTVIGTCEEQRHAFWIKSRDAVAAESKAIRKHAKTSCTLTIAGVARGRITLET